MVVVTWLRRRSQVLSAYASDVRTRSPSPIRMSEGTEKHRSRVQKLWKWPGLAVNERPSQVSSMHDRMMSGTEPCLRLWPRSPRRTRIPAPDAYSEMAAGCSHKLIDMARQDRCPGATGI